MNTQIPFSRGDEVKETIDLCDSDTEYSYHTIASNKIIDKTRDESVQLIEVESPMRGRLSSSMDFTGIYSEDETSDNNTINLGLDFSTLSVSLNKENIDVHVNMHTEREPDVTCNILTDSRDEKIPSKKLSPKITKVLSFSDIDSDTDDDTINLGLDFSGLSISVDEENIDVHVNMHIKREQDMMRNILTDSRDEKIPSKNSSLNIMEVLSFPDIDSDTDDDSILSPSPFTSAQVSSTHSYKVKKSSHNNVSKNYNSTGLLKKQMMNAKKIISDVTTNQIFVSMESCSNDDEWSETPPNSSLKNQSTNERVGTSSESSSVLTFFWRIVLLIDGNERKRVKTGKSQSDIVNAIHRAGFHAEIGLSTITSKSNSDGTRKYLPVGDYMMVARKIDKITGQILGYDKILNFIVERKHVIDLVSSVTAKPKGPFKPLSRMEQQMRKLKYCGIENPIILIEGNEDHHPSIDEKRTKLVKTFREQLREGELFPEFLLVETHHIDGTVQYLIGQIREMTKRFRESMESTVAEVATFCDLKQRAELTMKDQTFRYYLGLRNIPTVGDKKAMAVINYCTTISDLAKFCGKENSIILLSVLKTKLGKGGRQLGTKVASDIIEWCKNNLVQISSFHHAPYTLPFQSPSLSKNKSSTIVNRYSKPNDLNCSTFCRSGESKVKEKK